MKNVSSLKSNNTESAKTPGGISKSLLTPCRRVGLSRSWRRNGPSPFISPLSGNEDIKQEKTDSKKRKQNASEEIEQNSETPDERVDSSCTSVDINRTPSRSVDIPRRKKSKTLISAINKCQESNNAQIIEVSTKVDNSLIETDNIKITEPVSPHVRVKTKNNRQISNSSIKEVNNDPSNKQDLKENLNVESKETITTKVSPNKLAQECFVVIQKKLKQNATIHNREKIETLDCKANENVEKTGSQGLFDSDSDEVPLSNLNKVDIACKKISTNNLTKEIDEYEVFNSNANKQIVSTFKKIKNTKDKNKKHIKNKDIKTEINPVSPNTFDDDDDFDNKRTIIIKKTYDKVSKPLKCKSTGSITQRDIDELQMRIETKKKLLISRAMTEDTEELRVLIKKWQKGCQDALVELMELMKKKIPEKQNMEYSEILQTLKIPAALVGYDSDNDCFNTPEDSSIILGGLNL